MIVGYCPELEDEGEDPQPSYHFYKSSLAEARHPAGIREALRNLLGVIAWSGIKRAGLLRSEWRRIVAS
jgi:hypothetical protein